MNLAQHLDKQYFERTTKLIQNTNELKSAKTTLAQCVNTPTQAIESFKQSVSREEAVRLAINKTG